jgi:steroid 5-alpha reductase family enzyme
MVVMDDVALAVWRSLAISLGVQAVFFSAAATFKTDKVTDFSYGLTFVLLAGWLLAARGRDEAGLFVAALVALWGARLSGYLLYRIIRIGRDARFDGVREHFWPFFRFWLLQGLAVWAIMLPVTIWFAVGPRDLGVVMIPGAVIWAVGLAIEAVADAQKFAAKNRPGGAAKWVDEGLWRYARHPNYFGELLCWWGVFVATAPGLGAWVLLSVFGPVTITYLLVAVTGIPTLEASARRKWGGEADYQAYRARTRMLVPWPRRAAATSR